MADGPLVGFRILDLTAVISGPYCTQLLGDLGADVIKIEPPEGDSMRQLLRPAKNGFGAQFLNFNRNKRSIVIDAKKEQGRDLIRRLAVKADALVENNRPGVADRLGLGYADLRRSNPKIVYCSICGYGPKGRLANNPAYDPVIQGYSGVAAIQGGKTGQPSAVKMALADKISGMTAALAVVSALHAARARGVGQQIRVPMLEAMISFTSNDSMAGYTFLPHDEYKHLAPKALTLDPFKTKDGWITIAAFTEVQNERLCAAVGHPEWWAVADKIERGRSMLRNIAKLFLERTSAEWLKIIEAADIPCGPVHTYETLFEDEEIIANETFQVYEHPECGPVRMPAPGARFGATPMKMWRVPPKLGEQTDEILREAGIDKSQVEELRAGKVIV
ncbi:MAG TPA: CoA transferase [Candidatus Binataceae bacterium]|nr:CoA transferase [Candidatus Binataceae bacterium]